MKLQHPPFLFVNERCVEVSGLRAKPQGITRFKHWLLRGRK